MPVHAVLIHLPTEACFTPGREATTPVLIHLPTEACFTPGRKATTPAIQWQGRGASPEGKDLFSAYARKSAFLLLSGGL